MELLGTVKAVDGVNLENGDFFLCECPTCQSEIRKLKSENPQFVQSQYLSYKPVLEELVFRGYFQSALARRMPVWGAIAVTSLLFTFSHGPMALWPMYFMFSTAWGWVFARTGSVKAAIAFHVLNNVYYTLVAVMWWTAY